MSTDLDPFVQAHERILAWRRPLFERLPADWDASKAVRRAVSRALADVFVATVSRFRPRLMIEVGAHEATASQEVLRAWPQARAVAFEANPEVIARQAERVRAAGVDYVHALVADAEGPRRLTVPLQGERRRLRMGSLLADSQAEASIQVEAPGVTLDGYFASEPEATSALWIDAEGSTGVVLDGARHLLGRCQLVLAEVEARPRWRGQRVEEEVVEMLAGHGLVAVASDIQTPWQFNLLFARAELSDCELQGACEAYRARALDIIGQAADQHRTSA